MRLTTVKELFRALTQRYFDGANVVFSKQSRAAKMDLPLVTLTFGNVTRAWDPVDYEIDGTTVSAYPSRVGVIVDLFTHGEPVLDDDGKPFAHENTAMDDMLAFADFLGSQFVTDWCNRNDISVLIEGDIQELTGLLNDNNYEFRTRMNLMLNFTQKAVGNTALMSESSIQYPTGEYDEFGNPIYSDVEPPETTSTTGLSNNKSGDAQTTPVIVPAYKSTSSGGGSNELTQMEIGYFTEVELKEEKGNE